MRNAYISKRANGISYDDIDKKLEEKKKIEKDIRNYSKNYNNKKTLENILVQDSYSGMCWNTVYSESF